MWSAATAIVSGGNVLFTPTANFNGAASFDYTVTDNGTTNGDADPLTATATASFTVTEVNDAPSADERRAERGGRGQRPAHDPRLDAHRQRQRWIRQARAARP